MSLTFASSALRALPASSLPPSSSSLSSQWSLPWSCTVDSNTVDWRRYPDDDFRFQNYSGSFIAFPARLSWKTTTTNKKRIPLDIWRKNIEVGLYSGRKDHHYGVNPISIFFLLLWSQWDLFFFWNSLINHMLTGLLKIKKKKSKKKINTLIIFFGQLIMETSSK